jgi:hypothetical protein
MSNQYINWVKVYSINHPSGPVRIYLSSHKDCNYHGMVIYTTKNGIWSEDTTLELEFKDERFYGNDEMTVYNAAIVFINNILGGEYTTFLISETEM